MVNTGRWGEYETYLLTLLCCAVLCGAVVVRVRLCVMCKCIIPDSRTL